MGRWRYWGALISSYLDSYALHLDGSSQYAYRANPAYQSESAGGISIWMRINTLRTTDGAYGIVVLGDSGSTVGTYGRSLAFSVRRTGAMGTGNYLDITTLFDGTTIQAKSGTTALSAGSWMPVQFGSDAKIYLNGAEQSYQYWNLNHLSSGWFADVGGTNKDLAFGAQRKAGVANNYAPVDLNNILHLPGRPFTAAEAAEIAAGGMDKDPATYSFSAELDHRYDFENNLNDSIGSENLTAVGTPTYLSPYIARFLFNAGTVASITAANGSDLVQASGTYQFSSMSGGVLTNSNGSATYPVTWTGIKKVRIYGLTLSATPAYNDIIGADSTHRITFYPDGSVVQLDPAGNTTLAPAGTVASGVPVDLNLTLNQPMSATYFGAQVGGGGCWVGTMTKLVIE